MYKTIFHIKEMDCPSEEQIIRMKLADNLSIKQLSFDLANKNLSILHDGELTEIKIAIDSLNFGASIIETTKYNGEILQNNNTVDNKLLWIVLIINLSFFILEILFGLIANSIGLVSDSLDMLADAFVYGLSLYAISGTILIKKRVARISGLFQLALAIMGFVEVLRRFIGFEEIPNSTIMISISFLALIANTTSLIILNKSKSKEVHIKSSQIFTSNDVIANIGVIIAGVLVLFLNSKILWAGEFIAEAGAFDCRLDCGTVAGFSSFALRHPACWTCAMNAGAVLRMTAKAKNPPLFSSG